MHALALFQIRRQQIQDVVGAAQQGGLGIFGFECAARIAHVFVA